MRKNSLEIEKNLSWGKKGRHLQESIRGGSLSRMDRCNRCHVFRIQFNSVWMCSEWSIHCGFREETRMRKASMCIFAISVFRCCFSQHSKRSLNICLKKKKHGYCLAFVLFFRYVEMYYEKPLEHPSSFCFLMPGGRRHRSRCSLYTTNTTCCMN